MVVIAASAAARAGAGVDAVAAEAARGVVRRPALWFAVDTLEFLRRGGRIGGAQAWLGGALKIKPILTIDARDPADRARAHRGARVRAHGRVPAVASRRRRGRLGHPAHPGARRLPAPGRHADARSTAASRSSSPRSARSSAPTSARACSAWAASRWRCCGSASASLVASAAPRGQGTEARQARRARAGSAERQVANHPGLPSVSEGDPGRFARSDRPRPRRRLLLSLDAWPRPPPTSAETKPYRGRAPGRLTASVAARTAAPAHAASSSPRMRAAR